MDNFTIPVVQNWEVVLMLTVLFSSGFLYQILSIEIKIKGWEKVGFIAMSSLFFFLILVGAGAKEGRFWLMLFAMPLAGYFAYLFVAKLADPFPQTKKFLGPILGASLFVVMLTCSLILILSK